VLFFRHDHAHVLDRFGHDPGLPPWFLRGALLSSLSAKIPDTSSSESAHCPDIVGDLLQVNQVNP